MSYAFDKRPPVAPTELEPGHGLMPKRQAPITAGQALEALDELEASARGDEPFNHFAAPLVRRFIEQTLAAWPGRPCDTWCGESLCADAIQQAIEAGKQARQEGKPRTANPYKRDGERTPWHPWDIGWCRSREEEDAAVVSDGQIRAWAERHRVSQNMTMAELRCAFTDARLMQPTSGVMAQDGGK